jgi:tRNA A58 N-methylase Trm61
MARPTGTRQVKSYARDLEYLARLKTAIVLDMSLPRAAVDKALVAIDGVVIALRPLIEAVNEAAKTG